MGAGVKTKVTKQGIVQVQAPAQSGGPLEVLGNDMYTDVYSDGGGSGSEFSARSTTLANTFLNFIDHDGQYVDAGTTPDLDAKAEAFSNLFTSDGRFMFGSSIDARGRTAIKAANTGFFAIIGGLHHSPPDPAFSSGAWNNGEYIVTSKATVTYTLPAAPLFNPHSLPNSSAGDLVQVEALSIVRYRGSLIHEWRIYADVNPLTERLFG